jgi:UDP-GlcNAc3NAcA epimerase
MKKILTIVGARPQFVKAAVVSRALKAQSTLSEIIVHTGQHYDASMSEVFFDEMSIPKPGYNLEVGSGSHGAQTGRMMEKIEEVFMKEKPEGCLVYGDTNSTLAGALVAAKLHVPVAHVEAGLRSFNRQMPEEINRILTDHVSEILFCPTSTAMNHLKAEGLASRSLQQVGDVMFDAALFYSQKSPKTILDRLKITSKKYALTTLHRAENTDQPSRLAAIFQGLTALSEKMPVVLPLHPRTKNILVKNPSLKIPKNIQVIDPVGYLDMMDLIQGAALIATDSGGLQKEAFFFKVPCVTLRSETEWTELIEADWNKLADPLKGGQSLTETLLSQIGHSGKTVSPYGDGKSGEKIAAFLVSNWGQ